MPSKRTTGDTDALTDAVRIRRKLAQNTLLCFGCREPVKLTEAYWHGDRCYCLTCSPDQDD